MINKQQKYNKHWVFRSNGPKRGGYVAYKVYDCVWNRYYETLAT